MFWTIKSVFYFIFYLKAFKICLSTSEKDRQTFSMTEILFNTKIKTSGLRKIALRQPPTGVF